MPLLFSTNSPKRRQDESIPNNSCHEPVDCETYTCVPDNSSSLPSGLSHIYVAASYETLHSVESNVFKSHHSQDVQSRTSAMPDFWRTHQYSGDYLLTSLSLTEISRREFRLPGTRYLPPEDNSDYHVTSLPCEQDCCRTIRSSIKHSRVFRNGNNINHQLVLSPKKCFAYPPSVEHMAKPVKTRVLAIKSAPNVRLKQVQKRLFAPAVSTPNLSLKHPRLIYRNEVFRNLADSKAKPVARNFVASKLKPVAHLTKSPKLYRSQQKGVSSNPIKKAKSQNSTHSQSARASRPIYIRTRSYSPSKLSSACATHLTHNRRTQPQVPTPSPNTILAVLAKSNHELKKLLPDSYKKIVIMTGNELSTCSKMSSSLKLTETKSPKPRVNLLRQRSLTTSERQLSTVREKKELSNFSEHQLRSAHMLSTPATTSSKHQQRSHETVQRKRPDTGENSSPKKIKSKSKPSPLYSAASLYKTANSHEQLYKKSNCAKLCRKTPKTDSKQADVCRKLSPNWITAWPSGNDGLHAPRDSDDLEDSVQRYKLHPQLSDCALQVDLSNTVQCPSVGVTVRTERTQQLAELVLPWEKEYTAPCAVVKNKSFYTPEGSSGTKSVCSKGSKGGEETSVSSEWDTGLTALSRSGDSRVLNTGSQNGDPRVLNTGSQNGDPRVLNTGSRNGDPGVLKTGSQNGEPVVPNAVPRKEEHGEDQNVLMTKKLKSYNSLRRASSLLYLPSHPKPQPRIYSKFKKPARDSQVADNSVSTYTTCRDYTMEKLSPPHTNGPYFHSPNKGFNSNTRRTVGISHCLLDLFNPQPQSPEQETAGSREDAANNTRIQTSLISRTASCPPCLRKRSIGKEQLRAVGKGYDPKLKHQNYTPLLVLPPTPSSRKLVRDILTRVKANSLPQQIPFLRVWKWRTFVLAFCVILIISLSFALVLTFAFTYTA